MCIYVCVMCIYVFYFYHRHNQKLLSSVQLSSIIINHNKALSLTHLSPYVRSLVAVVAWGWHCSACVCGLVCVCGV